MNNKIKIEELLYEGNCKKCKINKYISRSQICINCDNEKTIVTCKRCNDMVLVNELKFGICYLCIMNKNNIKNKCKNCNNIKFIEDSDICITCDIENILNKTTTNNYTCNIL